jgi:glycosyltransferase involved in cell wall biosynthesis
MKISIITVCLNSELTILHTLNSVLTQSYKNIEHIIVDGGSTDKTLEFIKEYNFRNKIIIHQKKSGIYNAMNLGIKKSKGDYICILNADDIFNSNVTIEEVVKKIIKNNDYSIFLGDIVFFDSENFKKINRNYDVKNFNKNLLKFGIMPPHPGTFIKKEIYLKYGMYEENYKIASDFDFFLRILYKNNNNFKKLNLLITRMKTGGISGKDFFSYIISTIEIVKSFKKNKLNYNILFIILRFPIKLLQFINLNSKQLNRSFKLILSNFFYQKYKYDFNLLANIKLLNQKNNFILSAMNLAFLGSYIKGDIKKSNYLFNWPDGIFSKIVEKKIKKIPGRDILKDIQIDNSIKKIIVLGNLSLRGLNYLKKKFNIPITHQSLPFGDAKFIVKNLNIDLKKDELVLITLPTPKQEIIADYLAEKNEHFKIICIGGSVAIASGEERRVPVSISYLEFLWRLRYDTIRRTKRLLSTFYYFLKGYFFTKKLKNLRINLISNY